MSNIKTIMSSETLRVWHISDTHGYHDLLTVPENIDCVIFSGDGSNNRDPYTNEFEYKQFLIWMSGLDIAHKVVIAGNHDSAVEHGLILTEDFRRIGITYLFNSSVTINNINFWGSPFTPTFGHWSFMKSRSKIGQVWQSIPDDVDVVITHGPPKGVLDISDNIDGSIEFCGDSALRKRMIALEPSAVLFGHIHNFGEHINAGVTKYSNQNTLYMNGSVVTDRKFGKLSSNGNIFEINRITKEIKINTI